MTQTVVRPTGTTVASATRGVSVALFSIYAVILVAMILFKFPFPSEQAAGARTINWVPFRGAVGADGTLHFGSDVVNNVLIFVPFGIYLCLVKANWSFAAKAALIVATTVSFECLQYVFAIGRADVTDVLSNTFGGLVGIALYATLRLVLRRRTNGILNASGFILTICALAFLTYLLAHSR